MDKERRKQLLEAYKYMKPDMGVFTVECSVTGKHYIGWAKDLKAMLNRTSLGLQTGGHPNKKLQEEWNKYGQNAFSIHVLDRLDYKKEDDGNTDYSVQLEGLRQKWLEKIENSEVIKK